MYSYSSFIVSSGVNTIHTSHPPGPLSSKTSHAADAPKLEDITRGLRSAAYAPRLRAARRAFPGRLLVGEGVEPVLLGLEVHRVALELRVVAHAVAFRVVQGHLTPALLAPARLALGGVGALGRVVLGFGHTLWHVAAAAARARGRRRRRHFEAIEEAAANGQRARVDLGLHPGRCGGREQKVAD